MGERNEFGAPRTVLRSIDEIDPLALEAIAQWIEQRGLKTPVGQVVGYSPTRFKTHSLGTGGTLQTTTSTSWVDVGETPAVGLPPGSYFIVVTALLKISSSANKVGVGINENGVDPASLDQYFVAQTSSTVEVACVAAYTSTMKDPRTDIKMRWKVDGGTGSLNWAAFSYARQAR